ncbi:MAG: class I SAM-dependent methyltransferase [Oscillospiraceae bacterium]
MSSYKNFAEYYDILTNNIPYAKRGEYFNAILKKNAINDGILVDLACGTGSLSEVMSDFGYDVVGIDSSIEMLSVAMTKRYDTGKDILYLNQEMQELDLFGTINACICALDSLNHITIASEVQTVFNKVSMFLHPNGIFIFDVNTEYKHQHILSNNTFIYDYDEVYCIWQNSNCVDNVIDISLDLFCKEEEDDIYTKQTESFSEKAYSHEEILGFIETADLDLVAYYADDSFDAPTEDCQRIVYVTKSRKAK